MDRIYVMELVHAFQVGKMNRREFLKKGTAVLGSLAAANTLLAACASSNGETPPPVVDDTQPAAKPGTETEGELTTGFITYPGPQGEELIGYIAYQKGVPARPAVIVIQEWWGVNEHIKDVARRFSQEGFVALAPDLYHGVVTTEPNEARKLAMELGMGDAVGEIGKAVEYIRSQDFATQDVGIVGFCMGGRLVFQSAAKLDSLKAGVAFYGSPLDDAEARKVIAPILSFLGTSDGISVPALEAMHAVFDEIGLENSYQIYDGAQHAFFNDTRASYDPEAATDSWQKTLDWFRTYLNPA